MCFFTVSDQVTVVVYFPYCFLPPPLFHHQDPLVALNSTHLLQLLAISYQTQVSDSLTSQTLGLSYSHTQSHYQEDTAGSLVLFQDPTLHWPQFHNHCCSCIRMNGAWAKLTLSLLVPLEKTPVFSLAQVSRSSSWNHTIKNIDITQVSVTEAEESGLRLTWKNPNTSKTEKCLPCFLDVIFYTFVASRSFLHRKSSIFYLVYLLPHASLQWSLYWTFEPLKMTSYVMDSSWVVLQTALLTRVNWKLWRSWMVVELCTMISIGFVLKWRWVLKPFSRYDCCMNMLWS